MQNVEMKKRHLEDSYDSLREELAKLQAQGKLVVGLIQSNTKNKQQRNYLYLFCALSQ